MRPTTADDTFLTFYKRLKIFCEKGKGGGERKVTKVTERARERERERKGKRERESKIKKEKERKNEKETENERERCN